MIRFSLVCDLGHGFDSWFRDNASFDEQARRGLVTCPHCGSTTVRKAIMAPAVARTDLERSRAAQPSTLTETMAALSPQENALRDMSRAILQHVQAPADNVGDRFADEARRMHEVDSEPRSL